MLSAKDAPDHARRTVSKRSPGSDQQIDFSQVLACAFDDAALRTHDDFGSTGMTTQRQCDGGCRDGLVRVDLFGRVRQETRVGHALRGRFGVRRESGRLHGAGGRPTHPEITLNRPRHRRGGNDLAG